MDLPRGGLDITASYHGKSMCPMAASCIALHCINIIGEDGGVMLVIVIGFGPHRDWFNNVRNDVWWVEGKKEKFFSLLGI